MSPELIKWGIVIALFAGGATLGWLAIRRFQRYHLIQSIPTVRISDLRTGQQEVRGRLSPVADSLTAPLSGAECLYYRMKVEEERGSGKHRSWRTVANETRSVPVLIEDGSGAAELNLSEAEFHLARDLRGSSGFFNKLDADVSSRLESVGVSTKAWFGLNRNLRFEERYVAPGEEVFVSGEADVMGQEWPVIRKGAQPLIVTDGTESSLLWKFAAGAIGLGLLSIALDVVGVLVAIGVIQFS